MITALTVCLPTCLLDLKGSRGLGFKGLKI